MLMSTLGIVKSTPKAPIKHQIPTHIKGSKNPPTWYKTEPSAGPEQKHTKNTHYLLQCSGAHISWHK